MSDGKGHLREGLWRAPAERRKLNGQGVSMNKVRLIIGYSVMHYRLRGSQEAKRQAIVSNDCLLLV
jgi:hypothetical protein